MQKYILKFLKEKAAFIRKKTIEIHLSYPETRIASSLSCVEILVTLYYGKILNILEDKIVISKGHGAISLYPILVNCGYLKLENNNLENTVLKFGSIPDINLPTISLINGSLGNGLGQACGIALALKKKNQKGKVFVLLGDGELYEGSVWESFMFAGHHRLDNLIVIIDNNKICMLDFCEKVINLKPLDKKLENFGFEVKIVNGHNIQRIYNVLRLFKKSNIKKPKILIANTVKGKGVYKLENDPLCHIKSLSKEDVKDLNFT
ncbi:MAG: transketolase [Candidatus Ratteibacteria bacterium]